MVDFNKMVRRIYYTDGSFSSKYPNQSGWSFVVVAGESEEDNGSGTATAEGKHVSGEMMAVMQACMHAIKNGYKRIKIIYDNEGVYNWVRQEGTRWRTNNERTKGYQKFMDEKIYPNLDIDWEWVKGHSNNKFNDRADELAVKARSI